jgi:hypothetical protein
MAAHGETHRMNTEPWRKEIARARDAEVLLAILQRFVRALDVVDLRTLPAECRPTQVHSRQDIAFWSFALSTAILADELEPEREALGEIALVFAEAVTKTTSLAVGRKAHTLKQSLAHEGEALGS